MKDKKEVSMELLQEILDFLQTKPYHQVHNLINKILEEVNNE